MSTDLGLDDDMLAACVQCGLCLPTCPTFRATGEEMRSPRGRIDAMRDVQWRGAPVDAGFVEAIDSCVGCRACETACPSAVPFGELLHVTTATIAAGNGPGRARWWQRRAMALLTRPFLLRTGALAAAVLQRLGMQGRGPLRNIPRLPLRRRALRSTGDDVVLLTGCVMDAVQRDVHRSAVAVLAAAGFGVRIQPSPGCCGALADHAGLAGLAATQVAQLAAGIPAGVPVLSDSAGCGAAIRDAAGREGAPMEVVELARRTEDISTFLLRHAERLPIGAHPPALVAIQDPCHLRHVLGDHEAVGSLLALVADLRWPDDDGLCCGAGGAHTVMRPAEAAAMRDRKVASIGRCGATVVASANPGCSMHLQAAGVDARHPVQILEPFVTDMEGATDAR